jgi:hypothetical protein
MQGGTIDISIKTRMKRYALKGPIDGEDGRKFLLEHRPASKGSENGERQCYQQTDAVLELCIGKRGVRMARRIGLYHVSWIGFSKQITPEKS